MNEELLKYLKEELSLDELKEMVSDVNSWNGQLEDYYYYENDEYFFRDFFQDKVDEAVRATYYGDYNYMDDYVRFNAYGNLDSVNEIEYEKEIEENAEEIEELLPTQEGFFFGGTNYDEWYMKDIENTIEILENALADLENDEEVDFYYQSSW